MTVDKDGYDVFDSCVKFWCVDCNIYLLMEKWLSVLVMSVTILFPWCVCCSVCDIEWLNCVWWNNIAGWLFWSNRQEEWRIWWIIGKEKEMEVVRLGLKILLFVFKRTIKLVIWIVEFICDNFGFRTMYLTYFEV